MYELMGIRKRDANSTFQRSSRLDANPESRGNNMASCAKTCDYFESFGHYVEAKISRMRPGSNFEKAEAYKIDDLPILAWASPET